MCTHASRSSDDRGFEKGRRPKLQILRAAVSYGASINQRIEHGKIEPLDDNFREFTLRSRRGECSFGFVVLLECRFIKGYIL